MNFFSKIISFLKGLFKNKPGEIPPQQTETTQKVKKLKESYQYFYNEGLVHLKSGDNQKAIDAFTRAIELKGNLKEAYCSRGTALYKTGKENDALNDFMKALDIDPEYEKAYYNLAAIKIASGDKAGAVEDLSAILEIDPWNARIYFERASLKAQLGDTEGARADFAQSIQLDPSYAENFIHEIDPSTYKQEIKDSSDADETSLSSGSHHSGDAADNKVPDSETAGDAGSEKNIINILSDQAEIHPPVHPDRDENHSEEIPLKKFEAGPDDNQPEESKHKKDFAEHSDDFATKKPVLEEEAWTDDSKPVTYAEEEDDPDDIMKKALAGFSSAEDPDELKTFILPEEPEEPEEQSVRKFADAGSEDFDEPSSERKFPDEYETDEPENKKKIDFETVYADEETVKKQNTDDNYAEEDSPESAHTSINNNDLESFVKDVDSILGKSTNKILSGDELSSPHTSGKTHVSFEYEEEKIKERPYAGHTPAQDEDEDITESKFHVKHEEQETENATPRFKMNKKSDPALEQAQEFYDSGVIKAKALDFIGAVEDFTKAIELVPKHAYAHLSRGKIKDGSHDYQGALEDYSKAISFESKFAEAYFCRANLHVEMGNVAEAMNDYSRAIDSNARFIVAYFNRGLLQYKSGNYKEAIRDYTKAIIFDPRYAEAYLNRGLANYCINKAKAACDDWLKAAQYGIKQAEELIIRYAPREDIRKNRR